VSRYSEISVRKSGSSEEEDLESSIEDDRDLAEEVGTVDLSQDRELVKDQKRKGENRGCAQNV
jgi:hypothetical protein